MGIVGEIERQLAQMRVHETADGMPELRTSTMTHLVWAPPEWLPKARSTLAGLLERHAVRPCRQVVPIDRAVPGERVASRHRGHACESA